ncbi:hypothetical protein PoB_006384300 [Plakobranchus ocellatus]|uniref:Uncharacterized protein n=1 Tax=Plakobranchus ocellatus TaxID=259542 RepID=A0AAV4CZM6_9GAST|nr:hypothetical protein PoB_006384300 [Plakobranchus ocellatus]
MTSLVGKMNFKSKYCKNSGTTQKEIMFNRFAIIKVGRKLWAKSAHKERCVFMNDMGLYANLLLEVRKVAHDDKIAGEDLLKEKRDNFEKLTNAIHNLSTGEHGNLKASLKLAIGYLLIRSMKVESDERTLYSTK